MKPYGRKRNDWDYAWSKNKIIILYDLDINPKRERQESKFLIDEQYDEFLEEPILNAIDDEDDRYYSDCTYYDYWLEWLDMLDHYSIDRNHDYFNQGDFFEKINFCKFYS